ncbi:MAG: mechanosensitive ion channel domain-containing protein [Myxococcota bacterium]
MERTETSTQRPATNSRRARWSGGLACAALALVVGIAPAPSATAADESASPAGGPAKEAREAKGEETLSDRLERLEKLRRSRLAEADRVGSDAEKASAFDARALRRRGLELRMKAFEALRKQAALLEDRAGDPEFAEQKTVLLTRLDDAEAQLGIDLKRQRARIRELSDASAEAEGEGLASAVNRLERAEQTEVDLLTLAVELVELESSLGARPAQEEWLATGVATEVRLVTSRIGLLRDRAADLAAAADLGGAPAAASPEEWALRMRMEGSMDRLEALLDLMPRLGLDDAPYRQILVAESGEITLDVLDRDVAGDLISEWLTRLRDGLIDNGPGLVFQAIVFLLIVFVFLWLSRLARRVVSRAVEAPHLRFSQLLKRMLVSLSSGAVLALGFLIALSQLGIEIGPMLAGLGIAGFVLGFALQDTLGNFAAGVMILIYRPFDVSDMIDCAGGVFGRVAEMSLVSTTILTMDNKTLIVPNSKIWGDVITNVTAQRIRRVDLVFGIGYADEIPKAEGILESILADHPKVLGDPEPVVKVFELGDSSVNFVVRPWCARDDYWNVYWDVTREVKMRFDREGVSIPFPQRDVHLYHEAAATSDA